MANTALETLAEKYALRYNMKPSTAMSQIGASKSVISRIAEMLADDAGLLKDVAIETLHQREADVESWRQGLAAENRKLADERERLKALSAQLNINKSSADSLWAHAQKEYETIMAGETPEARDKLRLLEIFKQTINENMKEKQVQFTPQNQTAFITGCANILSGVRFMTDAQASTSPPPPSADESKKKPLKFETDETKCSEQWRHRDAPDPDWVEKLKHAGDS